MNTIEHLLTCLAEEGGEVAKDCHKALRFGLDDVNCENPTGPDNRARIIAELNDLLAVVAMLIDAGVIPPDWQNLMTQARKVQKVQRFMKYALTKGTLRHSPTLAF